MRLGRFRAVVGVAALVVSASLADAQPALMPGGLTGMPQTSYGPNLVQNPGFETLGGGGMPAGWTSPSGWSGDQLVFRAGHASYRRTSGAPTSAQTVQLRAGTYLLSAWIKTESLGNGGASGVRLTLDFRPGGINAWSPSDVISGTNDWRLYQVGPIVIDTDRTAAVQLENYNGAAGTAWFDDVSLIEILPQPVDVFLLYPNYRGMLFDDQPQTLRLDVTVTPPGGDFGRYNVRAALADEISGQPVAQQSFAAAAHFIATLDGSVMQYGRGYLASVSLIDTAIPAPNNVVFTYPAYRVSRVAGSVRQSMNVSFDAKNRVVFRGVPRFVLGVYDSGLGYSPDPTFWENTLWSPTGDRRMNGLNINMYLNYHYGHAPADAMASLMGSLQQRGVTYLQTGNCFDKFPADGTFSINASDAYVGTFGAHGGSAGYYTIDECLSSMVPSAFTQYQRLRTLDPDSMTFGPLLGNPDIVLWRDAADVIGSDPYPLFGAEPSGGYNLAQVADWTALTRSAVMDARPFMTVLQFFKFTSQGRFPTLDEMRNMAYMAIVEGARGLWWWSLGTGALQDVCAGWCAEKTTYMNNLKSVVNELAALEPVLIADDVPALLAANSNSGAIRTKLKVVGSTGYLIAYNYARTQQSATFTLTTAPSNVSVHAEGRTITPAGAAFTDTFGPYQAHIYVLGNVAGTPLTASFVAPLVGSTVSGTVPVTVSASGGSGTGFTYTIAADGQTIATGNSSSVSWNTIGVANGARMLTVNVRDSAGGTANASRSVTVSNTSAAMSLSFNGKLRDRVGRANIALAPDGAADGALTAALTTGGTRTITGLRLESTGPGTWDTDGATGFWALGVSPTLDGALLNGPTGAVSIPIRDGDSFVVFASDYANIEFATGVTLRLTATFADGSTATATTTVAPAASAATLSLTYDGKLRDRVGQGNAALAPDGAQDGTVTVRLSGGGVRTTTGLRLESTGPGTWDTDGATGYWALGVARTLDGALVNNPATAAVSLPVANGETFVVFASDYANIEFVVGTTLTLTATFSDGTTATATTAIGPVATLSIAYDGKLRDRVGQSNNALTGDGALDGTLTATLNAAGGRTVTRLTLESTGPGTWDTDVGTAYWALGVARTVDGSFLNNPTTAGVAFTVNDGGTFTVFASDYAGIEFLPGATLTLTATFSDATTARAQTRVP